MQHLQNILLILSPLFLGFLIKLPKKYLKWLDYALSWLVYIILLLIGLGLAQVDNLTRELGSVAFYVVFLFVLLMVVNILALFCFDKYYTKNQLFKSNPNHTTKSRVNLQDGMKQVGILVAGIVLGFVLPEAYLPPESMGQYALMTLILIVGLQLRGNDISLKSVLLNRYGMQISVVFMLSCALAGLIFSACLSDVSWTKGLALSSGYGWYSLSGIVMTQAYGATWGSVALLTDLLRELFALAWIPALMSRSMGAAIGVGGATSLDFTLPIIQKSGGLEAVPIAISFGFVVNVVSPFLMVLFSSF